MNTEQASPVRDKLDLISRRPGTKVICEIPAGATIVAVAQSKYMAVLTHPDRPAWGITYDGKEEVIP